MSSPINRKLGGLTGELERLGVVITPDSTPSEVGFAFGGPLQAESTFTIGNKGVPRVHQVAMVASGDAGGIAAFANPLAVPILVIRAVIEWTTVSSGACTVSVGVAADGTTLSNTLISGQSVATTAGLASSTTPRRCAVGEYVTASVASGTVTGLVGRVYIEYVPIG